MNALTWLGHSTFLLHIDGKTILIDPWLAGNPKCPAAFHDVASDAILLTHGHDDHIGNVLDAEKNCSGSIVGIYDLLTWLGSKGVDSSKLNGMNKGGTITLELGDGVACKVSLVDARHSSSTMDNGTLVTLGEAAGFVITTNEHTIYVAGDTSLFSDMALFKDLYSPSIAILPIGDRFTMDPDAAARACALLGVERVVPCHYGTFPPLTGTPAAFEAALQRHSPNTTALVLTIGSQTTL